MVPRGGDPRTGRKREKCTPRPVDETPRWVRALPLPQGAHPRGVRECTGAGGKPRREKGWSRMVGRGGPGFYRCFRGTQAGTATSTRTPGSSRGRQAPDPVPGGRASRTRAGGRPRLRAPSRRQADSRASGRQAGGTVGPREHRDRKRDPSEFWGPKGNRGAGEGAVWEAPGRDVGAGEGDVPGETVHRKGWAGPSPGKGGWMRCGGPSEPGDAWAADQ